MNLRKEIRKVIREFDDWRSSQQDPNDPQVRSILQKVLVPLGCKSFKKKGFTTTIVGFNDSFGGKYELNVLPSHDFAKKNTKWLDLSFTPYDFKIPEKDRSEMRSNIFEKISRNLKSLGCSVETSHRYLSFNLSNDPFVGKEKTTGYVEKLLPNSVRASFDKKGGLNKDGVFQATYGREFIESSYAIAKDSGDLSMLKDRHLWKGLYLYEAPSLEIFFDKELGVYWMETGSFD